MKTVWVNFAVCGGGSPRKRTIGVEVDFLHDSFIRVSPRCFQIDAGRYSLLELASAEKAIGGVEGVHMQKGGDRVPPPFGAGTSCLSC